MNDEKKEMRRRKVKCYISGPMTGIVDFNFPAFFSAENILQKICGHVVNPARIAKEIEKKILNPEYGDYLRADITRLMNCDCVFLLAGYEGSRGATLEKRIAEALRIPCFENVLDLKKFVEEKDDQNKDEDDQGRKDS